MNQSALIGGALLAGFVLFLAARDRLVVYQGALWGAAGSEAPPEAPNSVANQLNNPFMFTPIAPVWNMF